MKNLLAITSALVFCLFANLAMANDAPKKHDAGEQRLAKVMDSWLGGDINRLIEQLGAPDRQYRMPNGNRLFTWIDSQSVQLPIIMGSPYYEGGPTMGFGGDTITYSCKFTFSVYPNGRIFSWRMEGNTCRKPE